MAELVDALDSKSSAARRAGSIPALGTILGKPFYKSFPNFFSKMLFPVIFQKRYKNYIMGLAQHIWNINSQCLLYFLSCLAFYFFFALT